MPPKSLPQSNGQLLDTWGRRNRKYADRTCDACGQLFHPKHANSRFCSRPCQWSKNGGYNKKDETWWVNGRGYIEGRIWIDGKQIRIKKHRFVMEQYLGRKLEAWEDVHHINGDKTDNRLENLEMIDHGVHSSISNRNRAAVAQAKGLVAHESERSESDVPTDV